MRLTDTLDLSRFFCPALHRRFRLAEARCKLRDVNRHSKNGSFVSSDIDHFKAVLSRHPELADDLVDLALSPHTPMPVEVVIAKTMAKIFCNQGHEVSINKDHATESKTTVQTPDPIADTTLEIAAREISVFKKLNEIDRFTAGVEGDVDYLTRELVAQQDRLIKYIADNPERLDFGDFPEKYFKEIILSEMKTERQCRAWSKEAFNDYDYLYRLFSVAHFYTQFRAHEAEGVDKSVLKLPRAWPEESLGKWAQQKADQTKKITEGIDPIVIKKLGKIKLTQLIKRALKCTNYQEMLALINLDDFEKDLLLGVAYSRSNPNTSPSDLNERFEHLKTESYQGDESLDEDTKNEMRDLAQKYHQSIYGDMPPMPEILDKKLEAEFDDPETCFDVIRYKGRIVAIRKLVCKDKEKQLYYVGSFYIEEALHGISNMMQNWDYHNLPPNAILQGTIAPHNLKAFEAFTNYGWILEGFTVEEFGDLKSPPMIQARKKLNDGNQKTKSVVCCAPDELTSYLTDLFRKGLKVTQIKVINDTVRITTA